MTTTIKAKINNLDIRRQMEFIKYRETRLKKFLTLLGGRQKENSVYNNPKNN